MLASDPTPTFRFLDLPEEMIHHIVRHCSGDPAALSEAQFSRMRTEAMDREGMKRMRRMESGRLEKVWGEEKEKVRVLVDIREEWLRRGKWDRWELDRVAEAVVLPEANERKEGEGEAA